VPKGPEGPENEAPDQRTVQPLQPGKRETAPPYLFKQGWSLYSPNLVEGVFSEIYIHDAE
jgi:hypothetical protein